MSYKQGTNHVISQIRPILVDLFTDDSLIYISRFITKNSVFLVIAYKTTEAE